MRIFWKFFIFFLIKIQIFLLYRERGTEKRAQFWWCRIERWRYAILFSHRFFFSFLNWIIADPSPIARNDIFIDKHSLFMEKFLKRKARQKIWINFTFMGLDFSLFFVVVACITLSACIQITLFEWEIRRRRKERKWVKVTQHK